MLEEKLVSHFEIQNFLSLFLSLTHSLPPFMPYLSLSSLSSLYSLSGVLFRLFKLLYSVSILSLSCTVVSAVIGLVIQVASMWVL